MTVSAAFTISESRSKMAAEVEDDFLEESSSKPIFYSPEVEEAISQVLKIQRVCVF